MVRIYSLLDLYLYGPAYEVILCIDLFSWDSWHVMQIWKKKGIRILKKQDNEIYRSV